MAPKRRFLVGCFDAVNGEWVGDGPFSKARLAVRGLEGSILSRAFFLGSKGRNASTDARPRWSHLNARVCLPQRAQALYILKSRIANKTHVNNLLRPSHVAL